MQRAQFAVFFGTLSIVVIGVSCAQGQNTLATGTTEGSGGSTTSQGGGTGAGSQGGGGSNQGGTTTTTTTTSTTTTTTSTTSTTTTSQSSSTVSTGSGSCDMITCTLECFQQGACGQCMGAQCQCVPIEQCFPSGGVGGGFPSGGVGGGFPSGGVGGGFPVGSGGSGGAGGLDMDAGVAEAGVP